LAKILADAARKDSRDGSQRFMKRQLKWDRRPHVRDLPITSISVQRWLDRLSLRFRQIAMARLSEIVTISLISKNGSGSEAQ
jgi:hypothetical protein